MRDLISLNSLPHTPPMRWIRSAMRVGEDEICCEAELPAVGGEAEELPVLLGLEILAQAAGVLLGADANGMAGRAGRLLKVGRASWQVETLPVGVRLTAKVTRIGSSAMGLSHFSGVLVSGGDEVLAAEFYLLVAGGEG